MSFIEGITPYIQRIELHTQGKGRFSNREELIKVRDIHFEYIRSKDFPSPTDISCSSCLRHMMNQLLGEIGRQSKGEKMTFPKVEEKEELIDIVIENINSEVVPKKWGSFKKYCTSKGITVKGKKRKDLEDELNNL